MHVHSQWFDLQIYIGETGQYLKTELRLRELLSSMPSLNGIASFVDTIGCRNFNWTHKKVMHILPLNKTIYTH